MVRATVVVLTQLEDPSVLVDLSWQTFRDFEIILAREDGIVNAMNSALDRAQGEIFVRIDDDVVLPPNWLEDLMRPFYDWSVAGVTGPTFIPDRLQGERDSIKAMRRPGRFLTWLFDGEPRAAARIYNCGSVSYGSNFMDFKVGRVDHLEGTNWAMRTHLIRAVGGFDPAYDGVAEWFDTDVVYKVKRMGYDLVYRKEAHLWHLVSKGRHYEERFSGWGRMKNWLTFHRRHSRFHYKMVIWFAMMGGYYLCQAIRSSFRRCQGAKRCSNA